MNISVLILTLNEEANLGNCLSKVLTWCDDVVVLDSYSTDATERIAKEHGVRFVQREFDNFASQRNYGLKSIPYEHDWVLMLDADEEATLELVEEIQGVGETAPKNLTMFRMRRKDYLFGQWMRRCNAYPIWFGRLVRPSRVTVVRSVNEEYSTDGDIGELQGHLLHYSYNGGFDAWFAEHNLYSTMEAERLLTDDDRGRWRLKDLFDRDPTVKRRALKHIAFTLPGRPFFYFIFYYVLRGGFLDGRAALTHLILRAFYEYMVDVKVKEGRRRQAGLPI
jgi:glycosyltransferase involved in cell wall biosynthesis